MDVDFWIFFGFSAFLAAILWCRSLGVLVHTAWKLGPQLLPSFATEKNWRWRNGDPVSFVYNQTGTAIRVAGETAASGVIGQFFCTVDTVIFLDNLVVKHG